MKRPLRRWRILVAEDESTVQSVLARSLQEAGHHVTTVGDGWSAWREAQNQQFDLIITDQVMPHMIGAELIKRVREVSPSFPFMVITGYFDNPDTPSGIPADVPILYKPFNGDRLLAEVERILTGPSPSLPANEL